MRRLVEAQRLFRKSPPRDFPVAAKRKREKIRITIPIDRQSAAGRKVPSLLARNSQAGRHKDLAASLSAPSGGSPGL